MLVALHSFSEFNFRVLIAFSLLAMGEISLQRLNTFSLWGIVMFKPLQLNLLLQLDFEPDYHYSASLEFQFDSQNFLLIHLVMIYSLILLKLLRN